MDICIDQHREYAQVENIANDINLHTKTVLSINSSHFHKLLFDIANI